MFSCGGGYNTKLPLSLPDVQQPSAPCAVIGQGALLQRAAEKVSGPAMWAGACQAGEAAVGAPVQLGATGLSVRMLHHKISKTMEFSR